MAITLENAFDAIQRVIQHAKDDYGPPVAMNIVNSSGVSIASACMDKAPERVVGIAHGKAYTSAKMMVPTADFLERLRKENLEVEWFCDKVFTPLPGGVPVYEKGICIGGVGVSGRTLADDVNLASALAERVQSNLEA